MTPAAPWAELAADEVLLALRSSPGTASGFIDAHQWIPLLATRAMHVSGGHPHAQLRRAAFDFEPPVQCWQVARDMLPPEAATARQLRAHLYRTGAADGTIGDIVAGDAVSLATTNDLELAELLPGAERVPVWTAPELASERVTVSALRLDAVVAALFRVSRGEAQTAIEYGFVFQNFAPAKKRTASVAAGDQLVFRTKGRVAIEAGESTTRSGRVALSIRRYPV